LEFNNFAFTSCSRFSMLVVVCAAPKMPKT
jgi:hypothetical protein